MEPIKGLHHITAMAGDAQANVTFYQEVLGQRLVKTTVNFDDPGTYHLYYGDNTGSPGSIMTYFPWPHARRGSVGNGEAATVAYIIPEGSAGVWQERLRRLGVSTGEMQTRFDAAVLPLRDPEGMVIELVETERLPDFDHWNDGPVPEPMALRGFHGTTLWVSEVESTAAILTNQMGYKLIGSEGARTRYQAAGDAMGPVIDLLHRPGQQRGRFGAGSIHHIAFRVANDSEQQAYQLRLQEAGMPVTPVQDRQYFHSIYFRVPAGVLFEMATDPPGFLLDEEVSTLGQSLKLPPWLEGRRAEIEAHLPPLDRTTADKEGATQE